MYKHGECVKKCKFLTKTYNMSGHGQCSPSRILKSSPKLTKIGALNVTIPITSVMKQSSGNKSSSSTPTYSPITSWKNKSDPSGKRSPGSSSYKERVRPLDLFGSIRRSVSLDTIYLKGNWPTQSYWISRALHINKATQTDESYCSELKQILCIPESERTTNQQPTQRHEIGTKEPGGYLSPGETTLGSSSKPSSLSVTIEPIPRLSFRSSIEGLNQEIERIVQSSNSELHSTRPFHSGHFLYHETPEGHRAPLEDLLGKPRSQSVNTQTPHGFSGSSRSSEGSQGSSPDQESTSLGPSPRINKFIAREPPDGCEKIQSKTSSRRYLPMEHVPQPRTFKLQQSAGSAFEPLQPSTSNTLDQDLPLVPYEDSERDK